MLFRPIGTSKLQRIQGAFLTEDEIARLTSHWAKQGEPDFDPALLEDRPRRTASSPGDGEFSPDEDDLLEDAARIVVESGTASVSMIQRRLRVGYTRAGRLIDMLERRGHHLRLRGLEAAAGPGLDGRPLADPRRRRRRLRGAGAQPANRHRGSRAVKIHRVSVRAGIVVTGTEVITGTITDRNGPWISKRLGELGRGGRRTSSSSPTAPTTSRRRFAFLARRRRWT